MAPSVSPWLQIAANLPQINLPMVLKVKGVKIQYVRGRELSKSQFSWQRCQATGFKGVRTEQDFDQDFLFIIKEKRVFAYVP